ncbi:MAG: XdhC family protein [Colwellia sp.]|nr:XdhC family protein [Colwellia sp.]
MSNSLLSLLQQWQPVKDSADWVLGTIYKTVGPAYRKSGAMMLFSNDGKQLGMLSGGCLESDIARHAQKVLLNNQASIITYDGNDEDDISFQLGIGCGGSVYILLQPVNRRNNYLMLEQALAALKRHKSGTYKQLIPEKTTRGKVDAYFTENVEQPLTIEHSSPTKLAYEKGQLWLSTTIAPPAHILIAGGGIDARPVVAIAHQLGWQTSIWDPRPANARREYFPQANTLLNSPPERLTSYINSQHVSAVIVMSHHIALDAKVLKAVSPCKIKYLGLLGPYNRRDKVLTLAGLTTTSFNCELSAPIGLDLGGQLPESIALAMLSQCHGALYDCTAKSMHTITPKQPTVLNLTG